MSEVVLSLQHEVVLLCRVFFCYKQTTAYEMRISDWSSDVCSSDLRIDRQRSRLEHVDTLKDAALFMRVVAADQPFERVADGRLQAQFLRPLGQVGHLREPDIARHAERGAIADGQIVAQQIGRAHV